MKKSEAIYFKKLIEPKILNFSRASNVLIEISNHITGKKRDFFILIKGESFSKNEIVTILALSILNNLSVLLLAKQNELFFYINKS